ncbi:putative glycoprotein B [Gammahymrhavirus longicaudata]|uniref:Putative glycoprotein B n=1 Tax=Diachasmimorpha longicaudata rhabdovirus TaxID=1585246 RepID=A0A0X9K747_9RHAB|nr:putative glycoprotein B [Diachasmimorpha longicaudata rhabdovirus]ALU09128.1 putative glycoprotein B [Diachasmimorpha longicaudata rhabdovirus]
MSDFKTQTNTLQVLMLLGIGILSMVNFISGTGDGQGKVIGIVKKAQTIYRKVPSPPECELDDDHEVSFPVQGSIWRYKSSNADMVGFILTKSETTTFCHENLLGGEEKRILQVRDLPFREVDTEDRIQVEKLRKATFEAKIPEWECSYFSDNTVKTKIYHVKKMNYQYDPSTRKIVIPPGITSEEGNGIFKLGNNSLFITMSPKPVFPECNIELFKSSVATLVRKKTEVHQVIFNQFKEMYYYNVKQFMMCFKTRIYLTLGGYLISTVNITSTSHTTPTNPTPPSATKPPLIITDAPIPTSTAGHGHGKRTKREVTPQEETIRVPSYRDIQLSCVTENWLENIKLRKKVYSVDIGAACWELSSETIEEDSTSSRRRRSLNDVHEVDSHIFLNYQHELSRTELQWGLYHLANKTSEALTHLAKEFCLEQLMHHTALMEEIDKGSISMATFSSFYPDYIYHSISLKNNVIEIQEGSIKFVNLMDPLVCCERRCRIIDTKNRTMWLESSSRRIYELSESQTSCRWKPNSFIVQDKKTRNWIDVMDAEVISPLYKLKSLNRPDPLEFSFNTTNIYNPYDFLSPLYTDIVKSHRGEDVTVSYGKKFSWLLGAVDSVKEFVSSFKGQLIIGLFCIFLIVVLVLKMFHFILNKKVNRRGEGSPVMVPLTRYGDRIPASSF